MRRAAMALAMAVYAADIPECPSRHSRSSGDIRGVRLKEVDLVQWPVVIRAAKERQEHQQNGSCREEQGQ